MICSVKQSAAALGVPDLLRLRPKASSGLHHSQSYCSLPSVSPLKGSKSVLCFQKSLYLSSIQAFGSSESARPRKPIIECKAYEDANIELPDQKAQTVAAQKLKISIYFATWWALNVVFNIYNKKVPLPMAHLHTLSRGWISDYVDLLGFEDC